MNHAALGDPVTFSLVPPGQCLIAETVFSPEKHTHTQKISDYIDYLSAIVEKYDLACLYFL